MCGRVIVVQVKMNSCSDFGIKKETIQLTLFFQIRIQNIFLFVYNIIRNFTSKLKTIIVFQFKILVSDNKKINLIMNDLTGFS